MTVRLCPTTGKVSYVRASSADKAAAELDAKNGPADLVKTGRTAYRCRYCNRWHLTSQLPNDDRRRTVKRRKAVPA